MKKLLLAGLLASVAGTVMAEVTCFAERGNEAIEVRVIDTFVDRAAFISRTHPTMSIPTINMPVKSLEKSKTVWFTNDEQAFVLSVDKRFIQRSLPPTYKAELSFGNIVTDMSCIID